MFNIIMYNVYAKLPKHLLVSGTHFYCSVTLHIHTAAAAVYSPYGNNAFKFIDN